MRTIAFASAKGGTGKSSLVAALSTAVIFFEPAARVGVVDLDPLGPLTLWWNLREKRLPHLLDVEAPAVARARAQLGGAALDWLFLDCPPGFSSILEAAIAVADLVLVPTGPGELDLAAVASTAEMAAAAGAPFRYVLSRVPQPARRPGGDRAARAGRAAVAAVHRRVAIAEAMAAGRTAVEAEPGGAAARELQALWLAVRAALGAAPVRLPVVPQATPRRRG